jgi:hypothetical protein
MVEQEIKAFEASMQRAYKAHNALLTKLFGFVPCNPNEYVVSRRAYSRAMKAIEQEFGLVEGDPDLVLFVL